MLPSPSSRRSGILVPAVPLLAVGSTRAVWIDREGEIAELDKAAARRHLRQAAPMVCHAPSVARRLDASPFLGFDLLELFAFVRPARPCLPTPRGLARALGLPTPGDLVGEALALRDAARILLTELAADADPEAADLARRMELAGWPWGQAVMAALDGVPPSPRGYAVWRGLPEIPEHAPEPPPGHLPVTEEEARSRLSRLVGAAAEARPSQADYAAGAARAFRPRERAGEPAFVLAEAGTGVGKTLGYLAPASVWAEKNGGAVWISTYTRNLQHQIDAELDRLYPVPDQKALKAVVRKGRENYLCLLNFEEAAMALGGRPGDAVPLALMARWTAATRDGDLSGGDFPGWLPELMGRARTLGLADRRGECIHSACPHYDRCFIERGLRRSRRAEIVVANHALVMIQAALGGLEDGRLPLRLVFDEGHHVFDAADSAFSSHLTALEGSELRRWLMGSEGGTRGRARGLRRRIEELIADEAMQALLDGILRGARALPGEGWNQRLAGEPFGDVETFLAIARGQVLARAAGVRGDGYALQAEVVPPVDGLIEAGERAAEALEEIRRPAVRLRDRLLERLETEAEDLESQMRRRIEAAARSIDRRIVVTLAGWISMLRGLAAGVPEEFVDWLAIDRMPDGREYDVGMHRHWVDPTVPFAAAVASPAHGVLVTSATLTDASGDPDADWRAAEARTGASHLPSPALRTIVPSPFDYAANTRVFIVNDVRKDELGQVAAAYRALFQASGGGALGLFTAISRLRAVHGGIASALEESGIPLLAQHVDGMEVSSLIDIFRAEEDACLLGTDAVRDGVDVPGRSLRLIVFDRVPWPRPDILHRARRARFGGKLHDDRVARLRLKQAFGRLVRRADDRGVFVLLDPMMPTRLLGAFPEGVPIARVGLAEAVAQTKTFLTI